MSPFDSGCPHGNESPAYCKSCQDYEHAQLRKVATPSRARPSDRAIAAAFWEAADPKHSTLRSPIGMSEWIQERARELDTEPRAGDWDAAGVTVYRNEDMSPTGRLGLIAQDDGDMCVTVAASDGAWASVEFCASGGRSPLTLQALRNLSQAMKADSLAAQRNEGDGS